MSYQSEYSGAQVDEAVGKALNPEATPTEGSTNLVTSGGVASAVGAVQNTVSRRNLLDNAYFVGGGSQQGGGQFPINQRGLTSYSTNDAYCIDRWKYYGAISMTLQSDGVRLGDTTSNAVTILRQIIEAPALFAGKTLTFSVMVKDLAGTDTNKGFIRWYANDTEQTNAPIKDELTTLTLTIPSSPTSLYFDIGSYWNRAFTIIAVKLELGSVSTLANDAPPNFAEELAKCQRYCFVPQIPSGSQYLAPGFNLGATSSSTLNALITTPVIMRGTPTASGSLHSIRGNGVQIASSISIGTALAPVGNTVIVPINTSSSFSALTMGYGVLFSSLVLSADP